MVRRKTELFAAAMVSILAVSSAKAEPLFLLVHAPNSQLFLFDSEFPVPPVGPLTVTGLTAGEELVGIDVRPATGQLYGLGSSNNIYTIDLLGQATAVTGGAAFTLSGDDFGVDFNPVPDRIRVVSEIDLNLRLNPNPGAGGLAATDGTLAYAMGDVNASQNPSIVGAAYTNSVAGATTTTLYDIDSGLDILAIQNPPNNGTLNTVGPLGVNLSGPVGFDISGRTGRAYLSHGAQLYDVNLTTGAATSIEGFGGLLPANVIDIAVVPEPAAFATIAAAAIGLTVRRRREVSGSPRS